MNRPFGFNMVVNRVYQYLVFIYQAIVVVAFLLMPFWAIRFSQQPFLGVFLEHTLVTNGIGTKDAPEWTLLNQGLDQFGNQLTSLSFIDGNGNPETAVQPKSYDDIATFMVGHSAGECMRATFHLKDGTDKAFDIKLTKLTFFYQRQFVISPILSAWCTWELACGFSACAVMKP